MKAIPTLGSRRALGLMGVLVLLVLAGACSSTESTGVGPAGDGSPRLRAVAAQDTWGDLLAQVGGDRVSVTSIIRGPGVDAHDYEPKPSDSVAVAEARLMVVNGMGYDEWATNLVDANPSSERVVIDVGEVVGAEPGDDPHRWYVPTDVHRVVAAMAAGLGQADPANASYFDSRAAQLESEGLAAYDELVSRIRAAHAGTPIAVTESIFVGMAEALGLRVLTPSSFFDAVAEGREPALRDKEEVDGQIADRRVELLVYNAQNATPDVRALVDAANGAGIPVVTVTESISPPHTSFQDWQVRQLSEVEAALGTPAGP